jgi:hypothetical protein
MELLISDLMLFKATTSTTALGWFNRGTSCASKGAAWKQVSPFLAEVMWKGSGQGSGLWETWDDLDTLRQPMGSGLTVIGTSAMRGSPRIRVLRMD